MKRYLSGANGIIEALKNNQGVLYVSRNQGRTAQIISMARDQGISIRRVSDKELSRMLSGEPHRGYVLEVQNPLHEKGIGSISDLWNLESISSLVIILDGISDPRNLGAVLRSADQFSADAVLVPKRRSAGADADTLSRSSAGAVEWVPLLEVSNISQCIMELKKHNYWIWGADIKGEALEKVDLSGRNVLVLGREGAGLHRLVREKCDGLIRIPSSGKLDSLNVATAAGILMYEVRRQQKIPTSNTSNHKVGLS